MDQYLEAALNLHHYLVDNHWNGQALIGPDPGVRFNYRIGRFVKSYLRKLPWNDRLYYLQGQGYWVLGNWNLLDLIDENTHRDIAVCCSEYMVAQQRDDGAWDYPNPGWKGRIATAEGTWAAIGLLETYRRTGNRKFLGGVLRWYEYLINEIGFQRDNDELAINYFAKAAGARIPNNSITVLRFLAELAEATDNTEYLYNSGGLLAFIQRVQKGSGEFPYAVENANNGVKRRPHFQCYQYNAFECINLIRYYELTGNETVRPLIIKVLDFIKSGIGEDGHVFYECGNRHRTVTYHASAMGAAFTRASQLGLKSCNDLASAGYGYALKLQRPDGGFIYSRRDYHLFTDRRSYPRYLAMIMYHLLQPVTKCVS